MLIKGKLKTHQFLLISFILATIAFFLRIIMVFEVIDSDPAIRKPLPITDMATYHLLSDSILAGNFPAEFYYQPFYYAFFLPIVKTIFQSNFISIGIAQALCVSIIVWLSSLSAAQLHSRVSGVIAAFICTFGNHLFLYVPYALLEIQECLWFSLVFYFLLRLSRTKKLSYIPLIGLCFSFSILSRGNAWCFFPLIVYAIYNATKSCCFSKKQIKKYILLFLLTLFLPQIPFSVTNSIYCKKISGPSNAGSSVLTIGNNPESAPGSLIYPKTYDEWMEHRNIIPISKRILNWILTEPKSFVLHQAEKILLFFDKEELYNNIDSSYNATGSKVYHVFGFIPTWFLLLFFLLSFFQFLCYRRHHVKESYFYIGMFLYALATAAFYILARFRVPAMGILSVGASLGILNTYQIIQRKKINNVIHYIAIPLIFSCLLVFSYFPIYRNYYEPIINRTARPNGVSLETEKKFFLHDNSPMYGDGWSSYLLDKNIILEKIFMPNHKKDFEKYTEAYLNITFSTDHDLSFPIICNGKEFLITLCTKHKGEILELVDARIGPITVPENLDFILQIPQLSQKTGLVMDLHRAYNRTLINGEKQPFEAVIELELIKD